MPDPTGQMFSTSFQREEWDSFPNKSKKESVNSPVMFLELASLEALVEIVQRLWN